MAYTLRLDDARTQLTYIAGIDGQTGANQRHSPTNLNFVLNRKYRELRTRVSQLGYPQFLSSGSILSLPAVTTNEDYVDLPLPFATSEVAGVDIRTDATPGGWKKLDPLAWEQRRDALLMDPPHGVGFWAIRQPPSVSGSTATDGKIAVWPVKGGSYQIHSVQEWTAITSDTDVFLLYEGWDEWLLNAAAMAVAQRDTNKRTNWDTARDAWITADSLVVAGAARLQRGGSLSPSPYRGVRL